MRLLNCAVTAILQHIWSNPNRDINVRKSTLISTFPVILMMITQCHAPKTVLMEDPPQERMIIQCAMGPCFGSCPAFTLSVMESGLAYLDGKSHVTHIGSYSRRLTPDEVRQLQNAFQSIDFFAVPEPDPNLVVMDAPEIKLFFDDNKNQRYLTVQGNLTGALDPVLKICHAIAGSGDWSPGRIPKEVIQIPGHLTDRGEIIVQLKNSVEFEAWVEKYMLYEVEAIKRIAPNLNYWLVTFRSDTVAPTALLELFRADEDVVDAQFNRKLEDRF